MIEEMLIEFGATFAEAGSVEEVLEMLINKFGSMAGIEEEISFDELRQRWEQVGPLIDEAIAFAERRQAETSGGGIPAEEKWCQILISDYQLACSTALS